MKTWTKIGEIGVDAGIVWIGDPCYVKDLFKPWKKFCDLLPSDGSVKVFDEGVCVPSGYGDGEYSVYGQFHNGTLVKVMIDFAQDEDDE